MGMRLSQYQYLCLREKVECLALKQRRSLEVRVEGHLFRVAAHVTVHHLWLEEETAGEDLGFSLAAGCFLKPGWGHYRPAAGESGYHLCVCVCVWNSERVTRVGVRV